MIKKDERELVITRIFDVPLNQVWQAWTDPKHIQRWWGPKGFVSPACKNDFRVGGRYLYCMRSADGQEYWNTGVYREIVLFGRIVYTDSFSDASGNVVPATHYGLSPDFPLETLLTITFEELNGKTKFTLQQSGLPANVDTENAKQGWIEAFDRLENTLLKGDLP